jgi:hypothetical protein
MLVTLDFGNSCIQDEDGADWGNAIPGVLVADAPYPKPIHAD